MANNTNPPRRTILTAIELGLSCDLIAHLIEAEVHELLSEKFSEFIRQRPDSEQVVMDLWRKLTEDYTKRV